MTAATSATKRSFYEDAYDPARVLDSAEFRVLEEGDAVLKDKTANIACAYNPAHQVHLIQKPNAKPRKDEVIVHVRSTGICG